LEIVEKVIPAMMRARAIAAMICMGEEFHGFSVPSKIISLRGYDCPQTLCGTRKDRIGIFFFCL
jgi:hypothetical protein